MKNNHKKKIICIGILALIMVISSRVVSVNAQTPEFILDPLPIVSHEIVSQNSVDVGTPEEFNTAMLDESVDEINFTADIIYEEYKGGLGFEVNRDLRINGNGHALYVRLSEHISEDLLLGSVFKLGTNGFSGVFHLQNISIYHNKEMTTTSIVSISDEAVSTWDVIFDNLIQDSRKKVSWTTIMDTPTNKPDAVNLFLRNNVALNNTRASHLALTGNLIIEPNAVVGMDNALGYVITTRMTNGENDTYNVYVGYNANVTIYGSLLRDSINKGAFDLANSIDIYPGANLSIVSESVATLTSPLLINRNGMDIRIDTNASLKIASSRAGSAILSKGDAPLTIIGNPGSTLEVVTNSAVPTIDLGDNGSYISMSNPKYFSVQNAAQGPIFTSQNAQALALELKNTNIGLWRIDDLNTNQKALLSFRDVTYISSLDGLIDGSSELLNTIPSDASLANLSRISTINFVNIVADDIEMEVGSLQNVNATVSPVDAVLTYSSSDDEVVSVDLDGNLNAHKNGAATITIHAEHSTYYASDVDINITVNSTTVTSPILNVPAFSQIDLNSEFDVRKDVTAFDYSGANISDKIDIKGKVDVDIAGIYVLEYTVVDHLQNSTTATRVVLVNDGTYVYDNGFIIHGKDAKVLFADAVNITDDQLVKITDISVYSVEQHKLIDNPSITTDRSKLMEKPGIYPVTFTYNPSITVNITILDENVIDNPGDDSNISDDKLTNLPNTGQDLNLSVIVSMLVLGSTMLIVLKRKYFQK